MKHRAAWTHLPSLARGFAARLAPSRVRAPWALARGFRGGGSAFRLLTPVSALLVLLAVLLVRTQGVSADAACEVPPTNLTSELSDDGSAVVLTWEASPDCTPDEYAVYRRDMDVQGARMTHIATVDGLTLTYTDDDVNAGEHYRYRIRSNDQGARSGRTDITLPEATTPEPTPELTPQQPEATSTEQAPQQGERSVRQNFDVTPPSLQVANVDGTSLVIIYDELLDESSTPAASDYTVDIGGTDYTPSSVVVRGAEVALTLSTGAASGDTVALDYTKGTNPVKDLAGNDAVAETNRPVTNHTGATNDRPEFSSETITISVDENTPIMTAFGDPVAAADDDTSDTLTYSLPSNVLLLFSVGTNTGQFSTFAPLDFEATSSYVVPLYVRDSKDPAGGADSIFDDSIKVTINVNDVNEEPAIAGDTAPDVDENTTVVGTYTVSDPDPADTHTWSIDSATTDENQDGSLFQIGSTTGVLSFTNAPDYEMPGSLADTPANTYQVTIKVTDDGSPPMDETFDVIVNVVNVNEAPDITSTGSSHTSISKPEGTGPSDPLATYTAEDPEFSDTLTWSLDGDDAADFTITSAGVLRLQALTDYEDPRDHDTNNVYRVTVRVRDSKDNTAGSTNGDADSGVDDTIAVVVTITNIDEAGTVTLPGTITAGQGATATLTDHDGTPSSVTWQWSRSDTAGGTFTPISGATSNPYTPVAADVGKYLKATASYTDPHGSGKSATSAASSQVAVGNRHPSFPSTETGMRSFDENSGMGLYIGDPVAATDDDGDSLEYTLSGPDASSFNILGGSGQIFLKSGVTYNYESKSSYTVIVSVSDEKDDAGGPDDVIDDTITVTINLINVDEPGTVTISGMEVGGETLSASVTDIDGTVSNLTWQWALAASASGPFAPISGATNNTYTIVAVDVNRYLRATASYTDPQGSGKSASAVTGQIAASNNEPTFGVDGVLTREVAENSGANVDVGAAVAASDDDTGDTLYYWLTGSDASSFTIDSGTGQIKTKDGITYNFEVREFYDVSVNVRDNKDAAGNSNNLRDDTVSVIVNVTDVNETPVIGTPQTAISVAENQTSVLTYMATDPDNSNNEANDANNTLTWSVETADDGGFFEIGSSSGVLTFKNAPNFEDRQDAGGDGVYNVTVTVTDNGIHGARGASNHLSVSKSLAVTVTDVNETPTLTTAPATATFDENATGVVATYIATDPDATTGTMTWDLQGNDAGDFNITSNVNGTAELTFKNPPDYEMPDDTGTNNTYDLTVRVRDNGSPRLEDTQSVAITVNDLNETPVIAGNVGPSFAEIEFDHTATASELVVGTYTATDDDNADNAGLQTITFDVSGTDASHFSINANTGVLSFSIEPDFENPADLADSNMMGASDNIYEVVVEADDGAGESNSVGTFTVTVTVTNVNEFPEVPAGVPDEDFAEIEWDADTADLDVMTYVPRDEEISDLTQLSWSLSGTDAADFQITEDATTGHGTLSFRNRPNFEDPTDRLNATESHAADDNQYEVIVKISDGPNTRDYPMTVTVTNVNETPQFTALSTGRHADEIEYDSGTTATDLSTIPATVANQAYWYRFEARDEEGQDITWTITGPDAADFVIAEDSGFVPTAEADESAIARWNIVPDFENPMGSSTDVGPNGYVFTVNASDGTNTSRHEVFVRIFDVNERPEFTGTVEAAIAVDEHDATLDASLQEPPYAFPVIATYTGRDEEGGIEWSLTGTDAADFEIDSGGNVVFKERPNFEDPKDSGGDNVYNLTVVVTDILSKTNRRTAMQPVTVTVQDVEEDGAISVSNLNPAVGESVTFTISDPDGGIVLDQVPGSAGFAWIIQTLAQGGSWQQLIHSNTGLISYTYVADEDETDLQLRAIVSSYTDRRGGGKSAESEATAAITPDPIPNAPPRIREGGTQNVPEADAGEEIGDPVTATDRDNDPLTFAIGDGGDGALFEIHPTTGQLRTLQALDFETTTGLLLVPVNVSDGKDDQGTVETERMPDASTTVGVRVLDVEEEGVVTLSEPEPGVGVTVRATLSDGDGSISGRNWRWARSRDGRTGWSNIPNTTSTATTSSYTTVLADAGFFLRAAVSYTDNRGGGKRAEGITSLRVFGENQQPTFPTTEDGERTVPENSSAGTSVGAPVAADDPENDRLTYLLSGTDAASFTIVAGTGQLRVKDPLDFETKSSYEVTVDVHDGKDGLGNNSAAIDDSIDVTITVGNVDEPGSVTLTTLTATIQARVEVTAVLEDDDGPSSVTWAWARSPNGRTDWVNLVGATSARYTPTLVDAGNFIRATASYTDGHGQSKTASEVSPRVGDPPPVNSAPAFPATEDGRRDVPENARGGDAIGDPVAANDVNFDALTYSLSGTDVASFEIDASSGQLRLASGVSLDFEGKKSYRVTVSVSDSADQNDDPDDVIDDTINVVVSVTNVNEAPVVSGNTSSSIAENSSAAVATYTAADPERDALEWSVNSNDFWISSRGQLHFASPPDYEDGNTSFSIRVTATDPEGLEGHLDVTVTVTDVEEAGVLTISPPRGWPNTRFDTVFSDDDGNVTGESWQWARSTNRSSWNDIAGATSRSYTAGADDVGSYLRVSVEYSDRRGGNKSASAVLGARIGESGNRPSSNTAPAFDEAEVPRSVGQGAQAGRSVGPPVKAKDPDSDDILTYTLSGPDADNFEIDPETGQIRTKAVLDPDVQETHTVTVDVDDGFDSTYDPSDATDDSVTVIITVARSSTSSFGGGGFFGAVGGGGPSGPQASDIDFEWNVERDIEPLAAPNGEPTGLWGDGEVLWVANNSSGAGDAIYAYELESHERLEEREFELDETNRAPRGIWSDGQGVAWVSDSGQDQLFAYDLATGERVEGRDLELTRRNRDARGIWSDGVTMWVLDGGKNSLFAYDLASAGLIAEYVLAPANSDPRGVWSDGVSVWVSDDFAKRLFAYRLPLLAEGEQTADGERPELDRVHDEEFTELTGAGNLSPRGIWSDGDVMYVADSTDDRIYTYNMPDAIDARLASLTLEGVAIGAFDPDQPDYTGLAGDGVTETTVAAEPVQDGATVAIVPADADEEAEGHQVSLAGVDEIAVTVTSADVSRERVYRVALADARPSASCLRGAVNIGFSLVVFEGGSVDDLAVCAEARHLTTSTRSASAMRPSPDGSRAPPAPPGGACGRSAVRFTSRVMRWPVSSCWQDSRPTSSRPGTSRSPTKVSWARASRWESTGSPIQSPRRLPEPGHRGKAPPSSVERSASCLSGACPSL